MTQTPLPEATPKPKKLPSPKSESDLRQARRAEALRANLYRRKAQARARLKGESRG